MTVVKSLVRGAARGRPYLGIMRDASSAEPLAIGVIDGPRAQRLRAILGAPGGSPTPGRGLALVVAATGDDLDAPLTALAAHRRKGGRALALLVGTAPERRVLEQRVSSAPGLGMGSVAHLHTLDDEAGAAEAIRIVAEALGDDLPASARSHPPLREAATELLVQRAAKRAAVIGGAGVLSGATMPVLTVLQAKLVMDLAVVHDREIGMERGLELAAVVAAGFGWRAIGRGALLLVPGPAFALRGGVAYAGTRAIGEAAARWLAEGGDLADRPLSGLKDTIQGALRRGRGEGN